VARSMAFTSWEQSRVRPQNKGRTIEYIFHDVQVTHIWYMCATEVHVGTETTAALDRPLCQQLNLAKNLSHWNFIYSVDFDFVVAGHHTQPQPKKDPKN